MVGRSCSTCSRAARASIIYFRQIFVAYKSLNAVWKRCFLYATRRRLRLREGLSPVTCPRSGRRGHVQRDDWKTEREGKRERRERAATDQGRRRQSRVQRGDWKRGDVGGRVR